MADNTTLNSGSGGDTIATDDVGGVKIPRSKIVIGADGSNDGDVSSSNPLPVNDAGGSLTVDGTVTANLSATDNAVLDAIAASVAGTLTVDGSGATQPVSGTVTANLGATDNAVLDAIAASVAGSLTVDAANDGSLNVTIGDGSNTATIRNLASNDALNVSIVDGSGNQVTSFGGSGGTSATDDSAFTAGSGSGTPVMGFASSDTVDAGDTGVLAMDTSRRLIVSPGTALDVSAATVTVSGTVDLGATDNAVLDAIAASVGGTLTVDGSGVTQPVSGTVTANLSATDNAVLDSIDTAVNGTLTVDGSGVTQPVSGTVAISSIGAGANLIGQVNVAQISAGSNAIGNVGLVPRTSGGCTIFRSIDLDESEEQIKASAGQVYWVHAINLANAVRYLKFYNATAASVTVGTTTPVLTLPLPTQGDTNGAGFTFSLPQGLAFSTAITAAATTGVADADTGAPGANEVILNVGYA